MYYRQLRRGVNDTNSKFIPADDPISKHVKLGTPFQDYYLSVYKYTEEQKQQFLQTNSVKGVDDVVTDRLVFDFDDVDPEKSKQDATSICQKLVDLGIEEENLQISFSGNKGFHVEVKIDEHLTPTEHKAIASQLANGLESFDTKVYDHARPFRAVGSVNEKSGLYKIVLTVAEFLEMNVEQIKEKAKKFTPPETSPGISKLPDAVKKLKNFAKEYKPKVKVLDTNGIDWTSKPKWLTNCRYSLQSGNFGAGERNNSLLCLAATYRNQGFDIEHTYRLLKGVAEKQSNRTGQDRFSDNEIWEKIISQVYAESWKGGQFTCRAPGNWLHEYCQGLGDHKCANKSTDSLVTTNQVYGLFKDYTEKYESNVLFTGIPELDKAMKLMVGTSNGILAPPGVGKTSLCLQILEHNSLTDVPCLFYSYDMFHSALYMRMLQRESGMHQDDIYQAFLENPDAVTDHVKNLDARFKNVQFCFKAGQTIDELEDTIVEAEEKLGRKPKLVIVDYNELVQTDVSDATASSAVVAQRLRQIANEKEVCIVTLLQPAKQYCSPADEITNFNSVKGSSAIVQSLTLLLGCSRPGFDPLAPEKDKFFNITCLKNRNGPLFSKDFSWEGLTGRIGQLEDEDRAYLAQLRQENAAKKSQGGGFG